MDMFEGEERYSQGVVYCFVWFPCTGGELLANELLAKQTYKDRQSLVDMFALGNGNDFRFSIQLMDDDQDERRGNDGRNGKLQRKVKFRPFFSIQGKVHLCTR